MPRNLLLVSNSTAHGGGYLGHCEEALKDLFSGVKTITFIPYARPGGMSHDDYTERARVRFAELGMEVIGIHEVDDPVAQVMSTQGVFIGGGNTFVLLKALIENGLMKNLRARCMAGMPYMGCSAGSNVACASIKTTNDMPIVHPPTLDALQLVPFCLNPHYLDPIPDSRHMGETRETRIREFHAHNDVPVLGLREGCWLRIRGDSMVMDGTTDLRLFRKGKDPLEYSPGSDLSELL